MGISIKDRAVLRVGLEDMLSTWLAPGRPKTLIREVVSAWESSSSAQDVLEEAWERELKRSSENDDVFDWDLVGQAIWPVLLKSLSAEDFPGKRFYA